MPCEHRWTVQKYRAGVEHTSVKVYVITCSKCGETRTIEGNDQDLKKLLAYRRKRIGPRIALASILGVLLLGGGMALFFSSATYDEQYKMRRGTSTGPGRASRRPRRDPGESRPAPKPAPVAVAGKPPEATAPTGHLGENSPAATGGSRETATGMFHGLGPLERRSGTNHVLPEAGGADMIALLTGETIVSTETAPTTPEEKAAWEDMWRLAGERRRHELERKREREVLAAQRHAQVKAKIEAQFAEIAALKLGPGTALTNWDGDALPDGVAVEILFFDGAGRRVRPKQGILTCSLLDPDPGGKAIGPAGKTVVAEWRFQIEALSLEPQPRPPDWGLGKSSFRATLAWRNPQPGTQLLCTFVEPGGDPIRADCAF